MADDVDCARIAGRHKKSILKQSQRPSDSTRTVSAIAANLPNALSTFRFAAGAGWILLAVSRYTGTAAYAVLAALAATSDFVDGRIARRLGVAGGAGRWLDGLADIAFILAALVCEAWQGAIPIYIPILIALSFAQYSIDSIILMRSTAGPIKSRLGHWGGIVNYGLVLALAFAPASASLVRELAPVLALFYIAAMIERALGYRRG